MQDLKLLALDAEDLAVISAQLQDAVVRVEDMAFQKGQSRFALVANRFDWLKALKAGDEAMLASRSQSGYERRRTALRFERVRRVQLQGIDLKDKRRVLSLLAVSFRPGGEETPEGTIEIVFSGGAGLRLDVECIEAELRDLGAVWATRAKPAHELGEDGGADGSSGTQD